MKTRIHLVRHALSEANLDKTVNARKPDVAISLAEEGFRQAEEMGRHLAAHIAGIGSDGVSGFHHRRVRLMVSPYLRTRQTAEAIQKALRRQGIEFDVVENRQIREMTFGLYDGLRDDELAERYPVEHAHYQKHVDAQGEFYAPMPMGESRVQVADRVRTTFGTILRDMTGDHSLPVTDMIVVSHGIAIRAFRLEWFHKPWEWYENEPNPDNASVMTIEGQRGRGWSEKPTFAGFGHIRDAQERREEGDVQ